MSELSNDRTKFTQLLEKQTQLRENKEEEMGRVLDECVALKAGKRINKHKENKNT